MILDPFIFCCEVVYRGGVLDHLARKTYHICMHSRGNSACTHMALGGSGPPCTKNIPDLHTLGPQFWFWTTLYEKHTTSTYTRTPILHVRKTLFSYTHSRGNFACTHLAYGSVSIVQTGGSGAACTKNIPHLHALGSQFCMYEKRDK